MGMYDSFYMRSIIMPNMMCYPDEFQTKELDCNLDQYVVTPDGRLMIRDMSFDGVLYKPCERLIRCVLRGPIDVIAKFQNGRLMTLEIWK